MNRPIRRTLLAALLALGLTPRSGASPLPALDLPWPGERAVRENASVPPVVFAATAPNRPASGPSPAAIAAALQSLPVTGRLGLSPTPAASIAIGPHLLRTGERIPASLLPRGFPPVRIHAIGRHAWTAAVQPDAQPAWQQDIALPLTLP